MSGLGTRPADRTDAEIARRFRESADFRSGYLGASLRSALNAMKGARSALSGKRHQFARDILDREIADAERSLRFYEGVWQ
jgi:hypothetical protein